MIETLFTLSRYTESLTMVNAKWNQMSALTMKTICVALFSRLENVAQCLVIKIHFAIKAGKKPLSVKK